MQKEIKSVMKQLSKKLKKSVLWEDCKKLKKMKSYKFYMKNMIRDILLFYSDSSPKHSQVGPKNRDRPGESIHSKCAFTEMIIAMVTRSLDQKKSIPKMFHKNLINVFAMGHFFKFEMNRLKELVNVMSSDEECLAKLEASLVEQYSENRKYSFLNQMEMTFLVVEHLLNHFFVIIDVLYQQKNENVLQILIVNLKLIFNQIKNKNSIILMTKQNKKKIFSKLEFCIYMLDFLIYYIKEEQPNFPSLIQLNFRNSLYKMILKFDRIIQKMNVNFSVIESPQFQNLNRVCHLKLSVYIYNIKNQRLSEEDFRSVTLRFWQRSQGNSYFFRNLIKNEKRFKLKKNKIQSFLSFEGQTEQERKQIMSHFVQEIVNLYQSLPQSNLPGYFLHQKHFKLGLKVNKLKLNSKNKTGKIDDFLTNVNRNVDGYSIESLLSLCTVVFMKKWFSPGHRNYLKIRLASELTFKMCAGAENFFNKNESFKKLVKNLQKKSDSKFSLICRFYLLSLIQKKKDILNDPFFEGKKPKKKKVLHKLASEFKNKNLSQNNISCFQKWIKGTLKTKSIYKLLDDSEENLGESSGNFRTGLAHAQNKSRQRGNRPKPVELDPHFERDFRRVLCAHQFIEQQF